MQVYKIQKYTIILLENKKLYDPFKSLHFLHTWLSNSHFTCSVFLALCLQTTSFHMYVHDWYIWTARMLFIYCVNITVNVRINCLYLCLKCSCCVKSIVMLWCALLVYCVCVCICVCVCLWVVAVLWCWALVSGGSGFLHGSVLSGEQGFRRLPSFLYLMISSSVSEIPSSVPLSFSLSLWVLMGAGTIRKAQNLLKQYSQHGLDGKKGSNLTPLEGNTRCLSASSQPLGFPLAVFMNGCSCVSRKQQSDETEACESQQFGPQLGRTKQRFRWTWLNYIGV